MRAKWLVPVLLVSMITIPIALDVVRSITRAPGVLLEASLDAPVVLADGKHSVGITVRVTESGLARRGDLLQAWVELGSGQLLPEWSYTDETGSVRLTFTPNPLTVYEVQDHAVLRVVDTSLGRLIEVDKSLAVTVGLQAGGVVTETEGVFAAP